MKKNKRRRLNDLVKEGFFGSFSGMNTAMSPASYNVQGGFYGYSYNVRDFNDSLQQPVNNYKEEYYIHPGCMVRGVGFNNPDKTYTGRVSRIVKNGNGEVEFLYIQTLKNSRFVSIRADKNLELIIPKAERGIQDSHFAPSENMSLLDK